MVYNYAHTVQNQTTNGVPPSIYYPVPFPVIEYTWYRVTPVGYNVSVNGTDIAHVPFSAIPASNGARTWGFGAFQDQAEYFQDVFVTSENGTLLYSNPMTSSDILPEYDGAKRDRVVRIGDFFHTPRTVGATTNRINLIEGTISQVFGTQCLLRGLNDYEDEFLRAVGDYYYLTENTQFLSQYWKQKTALVTSRLPSINPITGLQTTGGFNGPANGTATSALTVLALQGIAPIANALGEVQDLGHKT
ncbi:hypothetical protein OIDMADRAFT_34637 [Oidiodendron maius Zn]|uniref:Uncharacterized protein n=1 Tax=Oidiodendron maius (strain Zn) TaxID=913774 RepID=A0A0C3GTM1_OIDMZ|nr:hypothetical protein OIDMADRAFT_34637 [Oidiodendron maius Zn]